MELVVSNKKAAIVSALCGFGLVLMRNYFNGPKTKLTKSMIGKVIIVTGASEGIGKETALQLLRDGATVIFACRDEKKTENVINKIPVQSERERAIFMHLDLSDFSSIKNFTNEFLSKFNQLDILVNNAGSVFRNFTKASNGIEKTFQVNTFGPMILTQNLLDILNKSKGRVVNVSSKGYQRFIFDKSQFESVNPEVYDFGEKNYSSFRQYFFSKLGNIYFTQYLHNYCIKNNIDVKVACLHPGVINTELSREYNGLFVFLVKLVVIPLTWLFMKTVKMGAQTTLHLCYLDEKEFKSGEYYSDCKVTPLMSHATDIQNRDTFVEFSRKILNIYGKKDSISLI